MATILIVDDHPINRQFLMTLLSYKGHRLVEAADGDEGLAVAGVERPDLVITDILMPTMDGYEFVRRLHADPAFAHIPIVFWSAHYLEREARTLAQSCGVSHILVKPCEPEEVLRTVDAALSHAAAPTTAAPEAFDREHLRVLSDKLSEKVAELSTVNLKLGALVETGRRLALERDLPRLLDDYCRAARDIIGAQWVAVGILEADAHTLRHFSTAGLAPEMAASIGTPQFNQGVFSALLHERSARRLHGLSGAPQALGFPPGYPSIYSFLGAAIASPLRVYGCLTLANKLGADAFSEEDERLATTLAAQLAVAYENAQLYTELERRAAELGHEVAEHKRAEEVLAERTRMAVLVAEVGVALTRDATLRDILQQCTEAMVRHLDAALARIWILHEEDNMLELQASAGMYTHIDGAYSRVPVGTFKIGLVAQERRPYLTNTVIGDLRVQDQTWTAREGLVAFAGHPLMIAERVVGVMALFARTPLGEATLQALAAVADQIALGIERARAEAALRASETHYRLLFDASSQPMWVYDLDTLTILAVNEAAVYAYGYARDEFLAMTIKDLRTPEDIPILLADLARLPARYDHPDTWRHRKKDGTLIDVEVSSNRIQFGGRPARLALAQDVTARKRAEAALRDSEARKGAIVESAIDGIITIDQEGKIIEFNPAAERLLGYPRAAAVGQLMADLIIPPSLRERHHRGLAHYLATGEGPVLGKRLEMTALRADGTEFPIELIITRVGVEEPALFTGFLRDITERQQAEARVLQQLARLALLHQITRAIGERQDLYSIFLVVLSRLEQDLPIAFGCFCLGASGSDVLTVTAVGPASQALAATVDLEEQTVFPLGQNGLRACMAEQTVSVLDTAEGHTPLQQRCARAGLRSLVATPLLVEDSISGLLLVARREAQGFSSGEGEFLRQVSEHVALAAHQAQLYAKLQQAYDDLQQSQQVVMQQERLRALGQMASGIAHDINNAISPVTLYVDALLTGDPTLSARAREYLTIVQQAAQDVAHTVARLREFYRPPADLQEALPVDLGQIVPQVVELTRAKWRDEPQQRGITITVQTELQAEGLPWVLGVESELREALTNLVFNAVDAMPQGGVLTLRTRATPTAVLLEVSDTGIGMDEVTRQRCLEPFYTTKGERGTGLGLAMVYGVLERHAPQLAIESTVGHGTTMRLLFPRAPSHSATAAQRVEVKASPAHLRILVIDDDPLLRRLLQDVLQSDGHAVTVADGGEAGLVAVRAAQARQEPFAVVLTDLGMPGMDGREVARAVKHAAPATPVILLTGWGQALQQDGPVSPHIDYLLSKPPKLRELRAALVAVTGPGGRRADHGHN